MTGLLQAVASLLKRFDIESATSESLPRIPLIWGLRGSGKSALTAAMSIYCRQSAGYIPNLLNPRSEIILRGWHSDVVERHAFPIATSQVEVFQLDWSFVRHDGELANISCLEIAGERVSGLDFANPKNSDTLKELTPWIRQSTCLLILVPFDAALSEIDSACSVLDYMQVERPGLPSCAVITKWDMVPSGQHDDVTKRFSQLVNKLSYYSDQHPDAFAFFHWSIGVVESGKIAQLDSTRGTRMILDWIVSPQEIIDVQQ
jgi:hypothetical protein